MSSSERSGPNSFCSRATRALLQSIDDARSENSTRWSDGIQRTQSVSQFLSENALQTGRKDGVFRRHDARSLRALGWNLIHKYCAIEGVPSIEELYSLGSEAITTDRLRQVGYVSPWKTADRAQPPKTKGRISRTKVRRTAAAALPDQHTESGGNSEQVNPLTNADPHSGRGLPYGSQSDPGSDSATVYGVHNEDGVRGNTLPSDQPTFQSDDPARQENQAAEEDREAPDGDGDLPPKILSVPQAPSGSTDQFPNAGTSRKRLAPQDIERLGTKRAGKIPARKEAKAQPDLAPAARKHEFVPFADFDFSLDDTKIKAIMHDIYSSIKSLAFEELRDMGIDRSATALFHLPTAPVPGLIGLYGILLGTGLASHQRQLILDNMSAADLVVALIGAFFCIEVFGASCLPTADHLLASVSQALDGFAPQLERECSKRLGTNTDTLLRRAYLARVNEVEFHTQKLAPHADRLATRLADMLHHHLRLYSKDIEMTIPATQQATLRWATRLEEVVLRGLALKCQLSCARERYHFHGYTPGERHLQRTMQGTHGKGDEVVAAVFPGLQIEAAGNSRVVYAAQVRLK
ncbi:hypothetical protein LTR36_010870 [Oleoguttula mirabilis]|uniref:Uncharacterized protein n=1 Tax=Oleoguttula mirabilis TaxID=1507867 RepID=A0AAV9J467_9PEZI|nr:hypothetical protein LTR36_010870 [Oleoguttula mirabilis]